MNLFGKAKLIVKATSHGVLDRIIDANSIEATEQLIRDLEAAMQAETTETIRAQVEAQTLNTKIAAIQQQIDDFNAGIEANLNDGDPSNDHEAETMVTHVMELESERDELKASEAAAKENYQLLNETLGKLKSRHAEMMKQLRSLRSAVSQAKTDQKAVAAVRAVNDLTTGVDSMHLGGALAKAQQESAVARQELKQAVGSIAESPEALLQKSKAAARIAEMRKKLGTPA